MRLVTLFGLLLGVTCLQVGNGVAATLVPAALGAAGWSEAQIGAVAAALYLGLLAGTGIAPHLINRVGHRRGVAMAALLGGASAALLDHGASPLYGVARLLHGFSLAVLFVAIESWVAEAGGSRRGRAVTAYTSVTYAALAAAPWLVQAGAGFGLAAVLLAVVAVPIGCLRSEPTRPDTGAGAGGRAPVQPRDLATALASGATAGALLSLTPLYCQRMGMDLGEMSLFLSAPLVVGLALQAPLGRWLDRPDLDAFGMKFGLALACIAGLATASAGTVHFVAAALTGGLVFGLYPLALALGHSRVSSHHRVAANAGVLRWWSVGAVIGPMASGLLMGWLGAPALFATVALWGVVLAVPMGARSYPTQGALAR